MSWSYGGDPSASMLDEVRFLLGDTAQTPQSLSDEEINWLIGQQNVNGHAPDGYRVAADAAGQMATRYLNLSSSMKRVGDLMLSVSYGETYKNYLALQQRLLRGRAAFDIGQPVMSDQSPNNFALGMFDDPAGPAVNPKTGYV